MYIVYTYEVCYMFSYMYMIFTYVELDSLCFNLIYLLLSMIFIYNVAN